MAITVYLIRHSESKEIKLKKKVSLLECNKNTRLSRNGKHIAFEASKNKEFNNIDVLISSDYKRAIETALFFSKNKKTFEVNPNFGERVHGVNSFEELPENFEKKQMTDENFKMENGESQKEVQNRMYNALMEVLNNNKNEDKIAIVSHSTAITFLLKKWCSIKYGGEYKFKNKVFFDGNWKPCTIFKLVFDEKNKLIDISLVKPELKVMSFNLRHIIKEEFFGVWKTRYRRIIDFIDSESPDIIGVQELTRKGKRYLKHNLKDYKIVGKRRHSIIFTNEYNCVLVKKDFKIKGHKTYSLSDKINILGRKSKSDNFPRICTLVHIERENAKFLVANTHIDNSSTENKKRLLNIFDNIVNTHKKEEEYLIITGDFNMTMDNRNLNNYSKKFVAPFKDYMIGTFPSVPDMRALDHIFLDQRLEYSDEKIYSDSNEKGFMSDHNPISCIVTIK
ncbi:MAG: histidine phosphatase family protein [Bacilli bacterium]|nr:histidine phosphatase family protein [Bacilli bacterium]